MNVIEYKVVKKSNREALINLYKDAGWWSVENDEADPTFIDKIIKGSFCFVTASLNEEIIGMGRAISDGVSDAYIQDVVILSNLRGKGYGKGIINKIIEYLLANGISWIGLISEPGAEKFYDSLQFEVMENYTPYKWKGKK